MRDRVAQILRVRNALALQCYKRVKGAGGHSGDASKGLFRFEGAILFTVAQGAVPGAN
jgi:hypothetical protein